MIHTHKCGAKGVGQWIDAPAGQHPSHCFNIVFGEFAVGAFSQRKQFLQFASVILVGRLFCIQSTIEVEQHGRINGNRPGQILQIAQRMGIQHFRVYVTSPRIRNFKKLQSKVIVPKQNHFRLNIWRLCYHLSPKPRLYTPFPIGFNRRI